MENNSTKPSFWRRLDHHLLTHRPSLWSTRLHRALPLLLGASLIFFLFFYAVSADPRANDHYYIGTVLLSILSLLGFVFWMIYLLRFNVFKRFGQWKNIDSLWHFLAYFLIIFWLTAIPIIPPVTESIKASRAYSTRELVNDINTINTNTCLLERDSMDLTFKSDTFHWRKDLESPEDKTIYDEVKGYRRTVSGYTYVDSASFFGYIQSSDSLIRLNDSLLVTYQSPDFIWVNVYGIPNDSSHPLLTSLELYRQFLARKSVFNRDKVSKDLFDVLKKYNPNHPGRTYTKAELKEDFIEEFTAYNRYGLYGIQNALNNIVDKKYRWDGNTLSFTIHFCYYFSLALTLLVFIFRHSTRRTFFLGLLAALVLTILTGLIMSMTLSSGTVFEVWIFFYFLLFSFLSATIYFLDRRLLSRGIALQIATCLLPLMPLMGVLFYYHTLRERYWKGGYETNPHAKWMFQHEGLHYQIAEVAGFILLLVLIPTVIGKLYRRWYSLPEN